MKKVLGYGGLCLLIVSMALIAMEQQQPKRMPNEVLIINGQDTFDIQEEAAKISNLFASIIEESKQDAPKSPEAIAYKKSGRFELNITDKGFTNNQLNNVVLWLVYMQSLRDALIEHDTEAINEIKKISAEDFNSSTFSENDIERLVDALDFLRVDKELSVQFLRNMCEALSVLSNVEDANMELCKKLEGMVLAVKEKEHSNLQKEQSQSTLSEGMQGNVLIKNGHKTFMVSAEAAELSKAFNYVLAASKEDNLLMPEVREYKKTGQFAWDITDKGFTDKQVELVVELLKYLVELKKADAKNDLLLIDKIIQHAANNFKEKKLSFLEIFELGALLDYFKIHEQLCAQLLGGIWQTFPDFIHIPLPVVFAYKVHLGGSNISLAWSLDSTFIAVGFRDMIMVRNLITGDDKHWRYPNSDVLSIAFSPDAKDIMIGFRHGWAAVFDIEMNQLKYKLKTGYASSLVWSPDRKYIAQGEDGYFNNNFAINVWDVATRNVFKKLEGHKNNVQAIAWSPNSEYFVASDDKIAIIWNALMGKQMHQLEGHTSKVNSVAWSPDGKHIVTGSDDYSAIIWDAQTGKQVLTLYIPGGGVNSVAWSPDSKYIGIASTDNISIRNAATGKIFKKMGQEEDLFAYSREQIVDVAWSPDGKYIAWCSHDGNISIADLTLIIDLKQLSLLLALQMAKQNDQTITLEQRYYDLVMQVYGTLPMYLREHYKNILSLGEMNKETKVDKFYPK